MSLENAYAEIHKESSKGRIDGPAVDRLKTLIADVESDIELAISNPGLKADYQERALGIREFLETKIEKVGVQVMPSPPSGPEVPTPLRPYVDSGVQAAPRHGSEGGGRDLISNATLPARGAAESQEARVASQTSLRPTVSLEALGNLSYGFQIQSSLEMAFNKVVVETSEGRIDGRVKHDLRALIDDIESDIELAIPDPAVRAPLQESALMLRVLLEARLANSDARSGSAPPTHDNAPPDGAVR